VTQPVGQLPTTTASCTIGGTSSAEVWMVALTRGTQQGANTSGEGNDAERGIRHYRSHHCDPFAVLEATTSTG
jgi:NaMN:DMB phosphoribosyltransferase